MTRANVHINIHYYLAVLIAFSLPFAKLTPVFILLMLVNWIVEGDFANKFKLIYKSKFALIFIGLYVIHLIGLIYSSNSKSALFDLEVKASLFIFPIVLSSRPFSDKNLSAILSALILGSLYSSLYLLSRSISIYFVNGENTFFYQSFSTLLHPSYLSMYLNVTIALLLLNLIKNKIFLEHISDFFSILGILFFSLIIILLSSKSGIICLILIYLLSISYSVFLKKKYLVGLICIISIGLSILLINRFAPKVVARLNYMTTAINIKDKNDLGNSESTAVRILVWGAANSIISDNLLFGVGNGDSKDELKKKYRERNIQGALINNLNAHNEFYQIFVGLGLMGFLVLFLNLLYPLVGAIKSNNYLYICFILIVIFNFCSESMLETQAGVLFYAFFNSLFCFRKVV